jgi:predicted PurR-regulated permease PerM
LELNNALQIGLKPLMWLAFAVLAVALLTNLQPILMPFMLGALLAYLGDPLADKLEEVGMSRSAAVSLCFSVLFVLLLGLMLLVIPMAVQQVKVAYSHVPQILDWIQNQAMPWLIVSFNLDPEVFDVAHLKEQLWTQWGDSKGLVTSILQGAGSSTGSLLALVANLALVPVVGFYLLRDWDILTAKTLKLLPIRFQARVGGLASECNEVVGAFLRGQLWVMAALAVIYVLGLWMVGLKLALLVGLLAGLASIVPYMGFAVGILAASVAGFMQFGIDWHLLLIGLVFMVGQVVESVLLTPILVGDKIGLHPVAVIFAVMAGGQLFGFVGVLLALPVAAIIVVLLRHIHEIYKETEFYSET